MQLMTWPLARLGSRFGLLFEPHHRRVMHSALGRFFDRPVDLAVGLIEPDGTERVLPFTHHGHPLYACEQFERVNSITFRGHSERYGLKFELNIHSPFYPQNEKLCIVPAFYIELRVAAARKIRCLGPDPEVTTPEQVRLFLRLQRPETEISVNGGSINLSYDIPLQPRYERLSRELDSMLVAEGDGIEGRSVRADERIHSLNEGAQAIQDDRGAGLMLDLPVTPEGSGIKWRLIWAAHVAEPIMEVRQSPARFRYVQHWDSLDAVIEDVLVRRDDNLALSRRFEKIIEQAPLTRARWHLFVQGFQSWLSNTFWCDVDDGSQWFSNWEGSCLFHSTVDVEYNISLLYLTIWPQLLRLTMDQWVHYGKPHDASGGLILSHDMGRGLLANGQSYPHDMPVEENANFLLLMQAYTRWTGDKGPARRHIDFIVKLADYLCWSDVDDSGFSSEGTANTIDDATPAVQYARKQTYLGVKRVAALQAAADLCRFAEQAERASGYDEVASDARRQIEASAWLGDHYAVCVDKDATGMIDVWTGKRLPLEQLQGWDDYSIYTGNGLLLPIMVNRESGFDLQRMAADLTNALRETLTTYGCAHCSSDTTNIWVSQNLWRDMLGQYLNAPMPWMDSRYWDLQIFSNTADQSFGFIDTYIGNELCFYPRGAVAFGYFLAGPRIRIDRLSNDGPAISIDPDRHSPGRWPLLPLADWQAGKFPVCVVDPSGKVRLEGELEPVKIVEHAASTPVD